MSREWKVALALFLVCTGIYAVVAGARLTRPSTDTHFVYQAECFLKRRLDLGGSPPHTNDWAEVEELKLKDGRTLRGQFLRATPAKFRSLDGKTRELGDAQIESRTKKYYVSFPPFPALLLTPLVALFGARTNDVIFTVLLAGLVPALFFLALVRIRGSLRGDGVTDEEDPTRALVEPLTLCVLLAFGTVMFFSSVLGQVWFTAQIVALVLSALYLLCLYPRPRPFLAGVLLGAMYLTRPHLAALSLLLVLELLRSRDPEGRYPLPGRLPLGELGSRCLAILPSLLVAAAPALCFVAFGVWHNYVRFGKPFEFGHTYLTTLQADNIQRFGLVNYQYLSRNLAVVLALLPRLLPDAPYVQVSYHGLALWITTPVFLYLVRPEPATETGVAAERQRDLRIALLLTAIPIALASLLYQNDGYIQFGYRFSLDYTLLLIVALFLGNRRALTTPGFRALVAVGIAVNLFGAITFGRMWQFYWNGFFPVP